MECRSLQAADIVNKKKGYKKNKFNLSFLFTKFLFFLLYFT